MQVPAPQKQGISLPYQASRRILEAILQAQEIWQTLQMAMQAQARNPQVHWSIAMRHH